MTEQAQLRKQVEQSEARLQMALGTSQSGIFEVDIPSMTIEFDETYSELLGCQLVDNFVTSVRQLVHAEDRDASVGMTTRLLEGKVSNVDRTHRMRLPSGSYR